MLNIQRQELHCHNCNNYVQFNMDMEMDGNHVLKCPKCGHEHCRVVKNGVITDDRWDQRNGNNIQITGNITITSTSTFISYTANTSTNSATVFLYQAWMTTTSAT